ncbi:MAG: hypothetical protein JST26_19050 [Bacteroidetes bacterium]|nr:hypothetical protein [Bacteroidota bacterium]
MRITARLELIKYTVLIGLLISVAISYNLWAGQRWFPKAPLFEGWTGMVPPYDYVNLALLLIFILLAVFFRSNWSSILLILFSMYLIMDDQNRLQPWFFNYLLIVFVLLCYKKRVDDPNNYITVFISLQLLVALIYIFSGIQKLNNAFVKDTYTWFIEPVYSHVSDRQKINLMKFGSLVPYVEMIIGAGLLVKSMRFIFLPLIIFMHVFILCMLGPMGKSYNYVVWPWNIVMMVLCLLLFAGNTRERYYSWTYLFKSGCFYLVIIFMLIAPVFSLFNRWPSYLSSSLYSGNTNSGDIILSDKALKSLPYYIRNFVVKNSDYNVLYVKAWCITELKTPCFPEKPVFMQTCRYIREITNSDSSDVKIEFKERQKLINF